MEPAPARPPEPEPTPPSESTPTTATNEPEASQSSSGELPKSSAVREALREFWGGLSTTSMASWAGIVAFCLAEFALCCIVATPRRIARMNPNYLMDGPADDYAVLSVKILAMKFSTPKELQVSYMGASAARQGLADRVDDDRLSQYISSRVHQPVHFNNFSSNNQFYEDEIFITRHLPKSYRGVITLVVSFNKDRGGQKHDEKKEKMLDQTGGHVFTGIYFIDHLAFFAARRGIALRFSPPQRESFINAGGEDAEVRVEKTREMVMKHASRRFMPPILGKSRNTVLQLIGSMNRRGIPTILLESPRNPIWTERLGEDSDVYREMMTDYAKEHDAYYFDVNPDIDLDPADFFDDRHLINIRARRRWQSAILSSIAKVMRERFPKPGEGDDDSGQAANSEHADGEQRGKGGASRLQDPATRAAEPDDDVHSAKAELIGGPHGDANPNEHPTKPDQQADDEAKPEAPADEGE